MAKMYFLPYANYELKTELNKDEVLQRLSYELADKTIGGLLNKNKKAFRGFIGNDSFKVQKIQAFRNSWNPLIKGKITESNNRSTISIKMTLHPGITLFSIIWISFIALVGFMNLRSTEIILWSLGMILFLYVLTFIFFNIAADSGKKALHTIFEP